MLTHMLQLGCFQVDFCRYWAALVYDCIVRGFTLDDVRGIRTRRRRIFKHSTVVCEYRGREGCDLQARKVLWCIYSCKLVISPRFVDSSTSMVEATYIKFHMRRCCISRRQHLSYCQLSRKA